MNSRPSLSPWKVPPEQELKHRLSRSARKEDLGGLKNRSISNLSIPNHPFLHFKVCKFSHFL